MIHKQLQLIPKERLNTEKGFSLVEVLLSIVIFALLISVFIGSLIYNQESERLAGDRARATFLAKEGLEAVRNMRDENFDNLAVGTHGLSNSGNSWSFSGSSDTTDIFTRSINISDVDEKTKLITSTVIWQQNEQRSGQVILTERLTNWQRMNPTEAEQFYFDTTNAQIQAGVAPRIYNLTLENTGIEDVTIASTEISWSGVSSGAHLQEITIDGNSVWTGDDASGSSQDIDDFTVEFGGGTYPVELIFDKAINGITVTITFTMTDGSTQVVVFTPGAPPDTTPPADVTDLAASNPTTYSIDLSWTAPGDDGNTGTATSYDIRYSTSIINSSNWGSATQVSGEPTPSSAGSSESMTVSGLSSNTTYYFALKTSDEVLNKSDLSNIASGTTLAAPQANYLVVNTATIALSGNDVINITLQNSGPTSITITSMIVSWSGVASNRRLKNIAINGSEVWVGNNLSGVTEDIADVTLISGGAAIPLDYLRFSNTISGIILSITFNMSDGSSKTVSGIGPVI